MSTEWSVSFEYRMTDAVSVFTSIIHFSIGGNCCSFGDRAPAVFLKKGTGGFHFTSSLENMANYYYDYYREISINRVYNIEVHQRYISNGNYRYFIKIDGEEVHSAVNSKARQYYNVKVYAGSPWFTSSSGYISNLQFTNFL